MPVCLYKNIRIILYNKCYSHENALPIPVNFIPLQAKDNTHLYYMGIKYFEECYNGFAHLDHKMGVWRIKPDEINRPDPPQLSLRAIVILTRGGLHLRNDDRNRIMTAPAYADFSASGVSLRLVSSSTDAEGYVFLFSSEFIVALFKNHPPFSRSYVSYIQSHPVCRMSPKAISVLAADCQSIMATLLDSDNIHRADIVKSKTTILYMEIANYFEHCILTDDNSAVEFSDRRMELFTAFVEKLRLNAKCYHDVEYYASEINITPQYLNRVVKGM